MSKPSTPDGPDSEGAQLIPFPTPTSVAKRPDTLPASEPQPDDEAAGSDLAIRDTQVVTGPRRWITAVATRIDREPGQPSAPVTIPKPMRVCARAVYTVGHGHVNWAKRAVDALTHGAVREQVRLARLTGNVEALAEWTDRLVKVKAERHKRLRGLPATIMSALHSAFIGVCVIVGLLILLGLWMTASHGSGAWDDWWRGIRSALDTTVTAGGIGVTILLYCSPPALLAAAWREGRRAANPPQWMVSPEERHEQNSEITPSLITAALMNMGITKLTKYLANGGTLEYLVPPREQGGGTYTQIKLPMGTVAVELWTPPKRVELLAGNLSRHMHEVWPQRQPKADARVVDLWVADKGTMDKPAPPWPLLNDGEFDVFRDRLPWGVTMRAEQVAVGMLQKHWLIGATSNQGKTTVFRLLALGLALDVTVELHIADHKGDGDWSMFAPRAVTLIEGSSDEKTAQTATMLEWGVKEVARRYDAKQKQGIVGPIPRELSRRKGSGFHPIYIFVDEVQIVYGAKHPVGGTKDDARAWRAAKRLHDQARAVNVHLLQATQRPDDRTLPVQVREGPHVRCALNVPNQEAAKMILGDAAERGARPQDLRTDVDAGTVVATGAVEDIPKGQAFAIVRTHYVTTKQAYGVIERAMELMRRAGRTVGSDEDPGETRDFLDDLTTVMGDDRRTQTHVVLKRLSELDPLAYESWTFTDLRDACDEACAAWDVADAAVRKSHGVMVVDAQVVARVVAERAAACRTDEEDDDDQA